MLSRFLSAFVLTLALLAINACGDDGPTGTTLSAPSDLATAEVATGVTISWSAAAGASSYSVHRRVVGGGGSYETLAADVTGTSYTDETVQAGTTYQYRVVAVSGSTTSSPSEPVDYTEGEAAATLTGTITGTRTLSADTTYTLAGLVIVDDGGRLNIPAGTLLLGSTAVQPTALIVRRGGRLYSEGTAQAPVVMTSANPPGERRRGDWGGVVLNGSSICNFPAEDCVGEGNAGPYGGSDLTDNSGRIVYTRIEFAGFEVSFGNELNALTLNGVGSGTELHHIQTHYGSDDGFEWFGGTVDLKYALATGISDDSFDYSTGWQGRGQFWIAQQDPNDADSGFEVDGNEDDYNATPFTQPTIYNVTLIGKQGGTGGTAGEAVKGMVLRRGTAGHIRNAIVMGFESAGIDIDNAETVDRINAGLFSVQNSIIFGNGNNFDTDSDGIDEQAIIMQAGWNNRAVDPGLVAPFNRTAPDFRPATGSAATSGFASPPAGDPFFSTVDFVGGVAPGGTPWYQGWTTFAQN
jgi:hypothetical protein